MSCFVLFPKAVAENRERQARRAADALRFIVEAHKAPDNETRRASWWERYSLLESLDRARQLAQEARRSGVEA
jgi:hypothetical protein